MAPGLWRNLAKLSRIDRQRNLIVPLTNLLQTRPAGDVRCATCRVHEQHASRYTRLRRLEHRPSPAKNVRDAFPVAGFAQTQHHSAGASYAFASRDAHQHSAGQNGRSFSCISDASDEVPQGARPELAADPMRDRC